MSDVLPSTIKIKEQDVTKHREHRKHPSPSVRKQSIPPVASGYPSLALDQRKKPNHKSHNSNIDASTIHQKVADLESQICVMKKQHLSMLEALHNEIESLKTKNKGKLRFSKFLSIFDKSIKKSF